MMNSLLVVLLLITLVNFFLSLYVLKYRKSAIMYYSFWFLLSIAIYTFGYAMELACMDLSGKMLWLRFQYVGISFLPTFWILLIGHYTGKDLFLLSFVKKFGLVFSAFILTVVFTDQHHASFYRSAQIIRSGPIGLLGFSPGPWYWLFQAYLITCLALSVTYLTGFIKRTGQKFKEQAKTMLWGSFIPILGYIIYLCGLSPYNIDLSPFSFSVVAIFYTIALYRHHFLDFMPPSIENVFRELSLGVLIIDNKSRITHLNKSMSDIFSFLNNDSLGKTVQQLFKSYPDICSVVDKGDGKIETDIHMKHQKRHFYVTVSNYFDRKKCLQGKIITFKDITRHKNKEKKLMESIDSKDKFFSILAHDLKGPISAIINFSDLLVQSGIPDKSKRMAEIINTASRNVNDLLADVLTWAMSQRGQIEFEPKQIELSTFFQTVLQQAMITAANKSVTLKSALSFQLPAIADYYMLLTIMRNLVSNAIKFTGPGGHVFLNAMKEAGGIIVSVSDNGTGMTEQEIKDLFRMNINNKKTGPSGEKGTGLGLIICDEFVKKHGGNIWVQSVPGKGSTFSFSLPLN